VSPFAETPREREFKIISNDNFEFARAKPRAARSRAFFARLERSGPESGILERFG
jgi:hypothetical protein